jgi:hypothetical protein
MIKRKPPIERTARGGAHPVTFFVPALKPSKGKDAVNRKKWTRRKERLKETKQETKG